MSQITYRIPQGLTSSELGLYTIVEDGTVWYLPWGGTAWVPFGPPLPGSHADKHSHPQVQH